MSLPERVDHAPILATRRLAWPDEAACAAWAQALAQALATQPVGPDGIIELHGSFGAGKTTFVRHLLRALGVTGRVKSPTCSVMEPYPLPDGGEAAHFDFYRFTDPREWLDAGCRDVFSRPGLKLCEWPDKAAGALTLADLTPAIDTDDGTPDGLDRQVQALAQTPRGAAWLDR